MEIGASLLSSVFDKTAILCRLFDTFCMFLSSSTTQSNSRVSQVKIKFRLNIFIL